MIFLCMVGVSAIVIEEAYPMFLTKKLKTLDYTKLLTVGPAKEEKKRLPVEF